MVTDRHQGPLRVLKSLYPEAPGICHNVLLHPPSGIVGGDRLELGVDVDHGAHALITTPGATRFYFSRGRPATQRVRLVLAAGARLEWLPLETIVHSGAWAHNGVRLELADGAEMIGWDVVALGLPASGQPFDAGSHEQCIDWPGVWLERGRIAASDRMLLDSPAGLAGRRVLATAWFAAGSPIANTRREALLDAARSAVSAVPQEALPLLCSGATAPQSRVVVLRALADSVEPAMHLLRSTWAAWRLLAWQLPAQPPRVWSV